MPICRAIRPTPISPSWPTLPTSGSWNWARARTPSSWRRTGCSSSARRPASSTRPIRSRCNRAAKASGRRRTGGKRRGVGIHQETVMDLRFTDEELAFRDEVRDFMRTKLPEKTRNKIIGGRHLDKDDIVTWQRILNAKGWAVPNWPVEWGGQDWSPVQQYIWLDELQQAPAPSPLPFNVSMVGPVIAAFGNEAQKKKFLPRCANLDDWWCQGFSEPGAGSDLASLKTSAKRQGDHYIVNGQKTWTTLAQYADWIFCLVRTDPAAKKQSGISFLLIDMKTPGITVRPIVTIDGGREVNEVFFDDVRVPVENLVGEENKGWDYAKFLLGNERTGIARVGMSKERIRRLKELAAMERNGDKPDPKSSILKIKGSEIQQAITELLLELVGPYALPYQREYLEDERWNEPPVGPEWAGALAPAYFNYRKVSIYGGSNEIQHNIVAKAILGF